MPMKSVSKQSHRRQSGAVLVMVGVGLSAMIIMLAALDLGFLYFYKREYQKAADLAAKAGAASLVTEAGSRDCVAAGDAARLSVTSNLGSRPYNVPDPICGRWTRTGLFDPDAEPEDQNAVRVNVSGTPPQLLPLLGQRVIGAVATAVASEAIAQLTVSSTLLSVNTEQSPILNSVVGDLLGGNLEVEALSWDGLLKTDVNLLSFLDALAVDLNLTAGDYDQVLAAPVSVGQLLEVAADVLPSSTSPDVFLGLTRLAQLGFNAPDIVLGDLLGIQSNVPASALDVGLNLFQLAQGSVQLASGDNFASADLPVVGVPGVATATVKLQIVEPPQISAIGSPALAAADPYGEHAIEVRTAQVRTYSEVSLSDVSGLLNNLTNALAGLLTPVVNFLDSAGVGGGLNLVSGVAGLLQGLLDLIGGLLCVLGCSTAEVERNVVYAEALAQPLKISLDAAASTGRVTDYSCTGGKSLTALADTSVAHLRIGAMTEADVFSAVTPTVTPVPVVEIGYRKVRARRTCDALFTNCTNQEKWQRTDNSFPTTPNQMTDANVKRYVLAGLGLKVDGPIGNSPSSSLFYDSPDLPEVGDAPAYQDVPAPDVLGGLGETLADSLVPYQSSVPGVLGGVLGGVLSLLNTVVSTVLNLLDDVLLGLLNPILNSLLSLLGVQLAEAELGANLTCEGGGGTLVE